MSKVRIRVELDIEERDFKTLEFGSAEDFEESCDLIEQLQVAVVTGKYELVENSGQSGQNPR